MAMQRRTARLILAIIAVGAISFILFLACRKKENVNLVNGVQPASRAFEGTEGLNQRLSRLRTPEERIALINKERPNLRAAVVYFLRKDVKLIQPNEEVTNVQLFYGSADRAVALDASGKKRRGYFKDELVARVHVRNGLQRRIEDVLVECLNGIFNLPDYLDRLQPLTAASNQFTEATWVVIRERGDSLVEFVDYAVAINLAQRHRLALYKGKGRDRKRIDYAEARRLENYTDQMQVTAMVYVDDQFNVRTGEFRRSPQRPRRS